MLLQDMQNTKLPVLNGGACMNKLGKISVDIGEGPFDIDLDAILPISQEDLSGEFTRQASSYAYIAMVAAQTKAIWVDAKRDLEKARASASREVRRSMRLDGIKSTEAVIVEEVEATKAYRTASDYEITCQTQYLTMEAVCRAMEQRAQMLQSLGAHLRSERDQLDMHIIEAKDKLRALRGSASSDLYGSASDAVRKALHKDV